MKVNSNTVEVFNEGVSKIVKKSDILIIHDSVEHIAPNTQQIAVQKEAKHKNKIMRSGVDTNDIIDEK